MRIGKLNIRNSILPFLILAIGVVVVILLKVTEETPKSVLTTARIPLVSVHIVEKATASPTTTIFGKVEASKSSILTASVEADIIEVNVLEGYTVSKGLEMIVMDDSDIALQVLQRQAESTEIIGQIESDEIKLQADKAALKTEKLLLALTSKAVERADRLARSQSGSAAAHDLAKQNEQRQLLAVMQRKQSIDDFAPRRMQLNARLDKANANLKRAQRDLSRTRITAPFDGRITAVIVSPGDRARSGDQLVHLYDHSQLEVRAQVPNSYIPMLHAGIENNLLIKALAFYNGAPFELILHRLSASISAGQSGIDAFFRSPNKQVLLSGDTLEIDLELPPIKNAIVLPPDSLHGSNRVYLVRNGTLQAKLVNRLGQLNNDQGQQLLIISGEGFENGDQILSSRLPQVIDGLKVLVAP